jgi:hypothetical protein
MSCYCGRVRSCVTQVDEVVERGVWMPSLGGALAGPEGAYAAEVVGGVNNTTYLNLHEHESSLNN